MPLDARKKHKHSPCQIERNKTQADQLRMKATQQDLYPRASLSVLNTVTVKHKSPLLLEQTNRIAALEFRFERHRGVGLYLSRLFL